MRTIGIVFLFAVFWATASAASECRPADGGRQVGELGRATNAVRAQHGQGPLRIDPALMRAAQKHACDIARRQTISHHDSAGRRPMQRLKMAGFRACFSAENVAMGTPGARATVAAWQDSPGHARNHQDRRARSMGFGVARGANGRLWWVGVYASPCPRLASDGRPRW